MLQCGDRPCSRLFPSPIRACVQVGEHEPSYHARCAHPGSIVPNRDDCSIALIQSNQGCGRKGIACGARTVDGMLSIDDPCTSGFYACQGDLMQGHCQASDALHAAVRPTFAVIDAGAEMGQGAEHRALATTWLG